MSHHAAAGGREHAADDLQQCGFARTVAPDNTDRFAPFYLYAYVVERPVFAEVLLWAAPNQALQLGGHELLEPVAWGIVDLVALTDVGHADRDIVRAFRQIWSPSQER